MKKKSIIGLLLIGTLSLGTLIGCEDSSDTKARTQQEQILQQANDQVGLPNITNFFEKKLLKHVLELRDDSKLVCYAYTQNKATGKFIYMGKCIGFGIPYGTEYTNPQKNVGSNGAVISQADPNALFSTGGTQATWVDFIDDNGKEQVAYAEPDMFIYQTKLPKRLVEEYSLPSDY
jgi:hypothetical protein